MASRRPISVTGVVVLDESCSLSLGELCRLCGISAEYVMSLVEEGLVDPQGVPHQWRFAASAVPRIQAALRLQQDMDINLPGVALALDLLDEVHQLRARVRALERYFE